LQRELPALRGEAAETSPAPAAGPR